MAIKTIGQTNFWTGMTNDIRNTLSTVVYYSENIETGKGKTLKQVVNNQAENVCNYNSSAYITKTIQVGTDIYGLGMFSGTADETTLWKKTNSLSSNWAVATDGSIAATAFRAGDVLLSSVDNYIYIDGGSAYVAKYDIANTTMTAEWKYAATGNLKGGTIWQGNIYGWNGQDIYQIDPVAETVTNMKAVSSEQTIVDLVPYGNLLMAVCTSTITNSKAYLWNGVSTTAWVDILDLGFGTVSGGANLDGIIYIVIGSDNKRNIKIKAYNGGVFQTQFTYTAKPNRAGTYEYIMLASKVKVYSGFIYFIITGTKPDGTYANYYEYAIARYGREEPVNPMTFSIYKTLDFTSTRGLDGQTTNNDFVIIENIVGASDTQEKSILAFINSNSSATTEFLSSTNTYDAQAGIIETVKYNGGDSSVVKQLKSVSGFFSALGSSGQVVMDYKKDEELTWTTIFTNASGSALSYEAVSVESTGLNLPQFKEMQFRFKLTGEAELTGWKAKFEELSQNF